MNEADYLIHQAEERLGGLFVLVLFVGVLIWAVVRVIRRKPRAPYSGADRPPLTVIDLSAPPALGDVSSAGMIPTPVHWQSEMRTIIELLRTNITGEPIAGKFFVQSKATAKDLRLVQEYLVNFAAERMREETNNSQISTLWKREIFSFLVMRGDEAIRIDRTSLDWIHFHLMTKENPALREVIRIGWKR